MRKIYEAPGMMEWQPELTAGRSKIRVSFEGGHLSGRGQTPASFETADPVVQTVIENSDYFSSGRIRLASGFKKGIPKKVAATPAKRNLKEMEFDSIIAARDYLSAKHSIPMSKLGTLDECVNSAAMVGINMSIRN